MKRVKRFFESFVRNAALVVCIASSLMFLGVGASCSGSTAQMDSSVETDSAQITLEEAKATALKDAELTDSDVTFTKTKTERDNGILLYDIEFCTEDTEYEYEIDASTGEIYNKSVEKLKAGYSAQADSDSHHEVNGDNEQNSAQLPESGSQNQQNSVQPQDGSSSEQISLDAAKNMALSDAGVSSSDAAFTKTKLDYDDGIAVYDIEFYTSTYEFEYEINAATGVILGKSIEQLKGSAGNQADNTQNSDSYIGEDKAKSIAVEHAGLSASDVTFSKVKLENDDGYKVYEIEFYVNSTEYEYKIDASTGTILEYASEWHD